MALEDFVINRMTVDYVLKPFDCGDPDINEFLNKDARLYLQQHLAVTYVIENDEDTIAYFSVQNDKISLNDFPSKSQFRKARKQVPHSKSYESYPAVKIGRLGVSAKYSGQGIGQGILDYLKFMFITNNRTGCRFMLVDAYSSKIKFYEKAKFQLLKPSDANLKTQLMYCDLISITTPPLEISQS
jgi:GNAT superfamily N-acetyltransferase